MAASRLSRQDLKDLEKFVKYLTFKSAMIVVQSRLGTKVHTQSKNLSSGTDWFNLTIRDNPDVLAQIKKVYDVGSPMSGKTVCMEISLKMAEDETMVLETWWLEMLERGDPSTRVSFTVYNRIGALLKSLLCVTRATPAYQLSRRQGPDSYVICYRFYAGKPELDHLRDGQTRQAVGTVPTPVGTVCMMVAYRTKLLMSPKLHITKDLVQDIKDDYFHTEAATCAKLNAASLPGWRENAHPVDFSVVDLIPENNTNITETTSNSVSGLEQPKHFEVRSMDGARDVRLQDSVPVIAAIEIGMNQEHKNNIPQVCQADDLDLELLTSAEQPMVLTSNHSSSVVSHNSSAPEDFVMLEMKTGAEDVESEDLGKFYHDCKSAPPLSMFQQSTGLQDMLNSITDQLAQFDASAQEFDDFVNSIQEINF